MGKREKREKRRQERLDQYFKVRMGLVVKTCGKCGFKVTILPVDSWATCNCGHTVSRFQS